MSIEQYLTFRTSAKESKSFEYSNPYIKKLIIQGEFGLAIKTPASYIGVLGYEAKPCSGLQLSANASHDKQMDGLVG